MLATTREFINRNYTYIPANVFEQLISGYLTQLQNSQTLALELGRQIKPHLNAVVICLDNYMQRKSRERLFTSMRLLVEIKVEDKIKTLLDNDIKNILLICFEYLEFEGLVNDIKNNFISLMNVYNSLETDLDIDKMKEMANVLKSKINRLITEIESDTSFKYHKSKDSDKPSIGSNKKQKTSLI